MHQERSCFLKAYYKSFLTLSFLVSLFLILITCCGCSPSSDPLTRSANLTNAEAEITFMAEVRWVPLEGGFYGLVAEDGRRFLPLDLPEKFQKDGLKIRVRGKIRKDVVTFYLWGTPFEIREIEGGI